MYQFKSLNALLAHFSDQKTCREYLEQKLWKGQPVCPHCQSTRVYRLSNGIQFKCGNKKTCDKKFTVTVGTIFENTKIPLNLWISAIYLSTSHKKGISSLQLSRDLGVTQKTAWFMLHRIRKMVTPKTKQTLKTKVQIDECYYGGKEGNKSKFKRLQAQRGERSIEKTPILGFLEEDGQAILQVIPVANSETVLPIIERIVEPNTVIVTDSSSIYFRLQDNARYGGHISVNHTQGEYVNGDFTTNSVESFFACLKRSIYGIYHQVSVKHLQKYCEETCYRFNTRKLKDYERFDYTFTKMACRLKYEDLIKK